MVEGQRSFQTRMRKNHSSVSRVTAFGYKSRQKPRSSEREFLANSRALPSSDQLAATTKMLHEALMITSLSCVPLLLYKPALGWLRKKKISTHGAEALAEEGSPAAAAVRWCGRCLSAWLILHLLIILSLVRGISSGGGAFAPELDKWQLVLYKKLPCRALTRVWGRIALIHLAPLTRRPVLGLFCLLYGIKLEDVKQRELRQYSSLHEFFTRALREESRPVCPDHSLVSPADGTIIHVGRIDNGEVKQVKGVNYKLADFLGGTPLQGDIEFDYATEEDYDWPNEMGLPRNDSVTSLFQSFPYLKPSRGNELYHVVVYLSVSDYHHFHSPADWNIQMRRHIVGELLSVAPWVVRQVPDLFCLSERVLLGGYWEHGFFSLTAVGAYNVGSIEVDIDKELVTNSSRDEDERGEMYRGECCDRVFGCEGVPVRKGDHVGLFHLGSTVVLVFEAPKTFEFAIRAGDRVKYGQPLGTAVTKMHSMELYSE